MNAVTGKWIARRMSKSKPMTKREMLRKWPVLKSLDEISQGIDWIEANTTTSDNPFLFNWEAGEARWGFRSTWEPVKINLAWNLSYLTTRADTTAMVLGHAVNSPVVSMTPAEMRLAKSLHAQLSGLVATLEMVRDALKV